MSKQEQRERAKARRSGLTQDEIDTMSARISLYVPSITESYKTILIYSSKNPEVNTRAITARLISEGRDVVVPIIEKETRTLRLSYLRDMSVLVKSTFNVPEPIGNEIPADPNDIEVAIIPMIAFDVMGNRLGYGAGYYDKFLHANRHVVKVGLAFSCQQEQNIKYDVNDIHMDYVITECGIIPCSTIRLNSGVSNG